MTEAPPPILPPIPKGYDIGSLRAYIRKVRSEEFRKALFGNRQMIVDYVLSRSASRKTMELTIYGRTRYSEKDVLLIHHQCRRLFRIQDRIWARME